MQVNGCHVRVTAIFVFWIVAVAMNQVGVDVMNCTSVWSECGSQMSTTTSPTITTFKTTSACIVARLWNFTT